jgi:hypothetical protein
VADVSISWWVVAAPMRGVPAVTTFEQMFTIRP